MLRYKILFRFEFLEKAPDENTDVSVIPRAEIRNGIDAQQIDVEMIE